MPTGVVFLDKPAGISSFAALSAVKRAAGTRRVGHTGTLDPFATGLLMALVGSATRTARFFNGLPKCYLTTIAFGTETDTDDVTGAVTSTAAPPEREHLTDALDVFRGTITQFPPSYSAVHVDGRRAHEIARSGETPAVRERTVTVYDLTLLEERTHNGGLAEVDLRVTCSAGTYIRSIARDLGRAMGSAAHVATLRRTMVGPFAVDAAVSSDQIEIPRDLRDIGDVLCELPGFRRVVVDRDTASRVAHGKSLHAASIGRGAGWEPVPGAHAVATSEDETLVLVHDGRAIAIGTIERDRFVYGIVLPQGGDA